MADKKEELAESILVDKYDEVSDEDGGSVKNEELNNTELTIGTNITRAINELENIGSFTGSDLTVFVEKGRLEIEIVFRFSQDGVNSNVVSKMKSGVLGRFEIEGIKPQNVETEVLNEEDLSVQVHFV